MATPEEQKTRQRDQWSAVAPGWLKNADWVQRHLAVLSQRLLDDAGVTAGTRLLDLACGFGEPAVSAAARGAQVLAVDLSPQMLEVTRARAARAGVAVETRLMDVEQMELPDASFDAVTCRFGLMFCPHPEAVAREIRRVLMPGGRFSVAVWDEPAKNPFFAALGRLVQQHAHAAPPDPKAPGLFRLSGPGELEEVLRAGDFRELTVEPMSVVLEHASPEEYWEVQRELVAPLADAVSRLPPDEVEQLREAVLGMAAGYRDGDLMRFPAQPLLGFGAR